ncbi:MAG: hypothetical protein HUJ68_11960 [Clostridia bacterium]|nr:hypothetical protein [Clostridia bacterium]
MENLAYIFGFWLGNGKHNYCIKVKKKDKYILDRVSEILKKPIYYNKDNRQYELFFNPNKVFKNYRMLMKKHTSHFMRGILDSCGEVKLIKRNRVNLAFRYENIDFLKQIRYLLVSEAGVLNGSFYKGKDYYSLKFGSRDTKLIRDYIYNNDNNLFLKRKKDKFNIL